MNDALDRLTRAAETVAALAVAAIALIVCYEIGARYLFDAPTLWAQDLSVYLLLWFAFLGLAPAQRAGEHIRIDLLVKRLGPVPRRWLLGASHLAVAGFALAACWSGTQIVLQSIQLGRRSMSLFAVPMWLPQLALPLGTALLALVCLARALAVARGREQA